MVTIEFGSTNDMVISSEQQITTKQDIDDTILATVTIPYLTSRQMRRRMPYPPCLSSQ